MSNLLSLEALCFFDVDAGPTYFESVFNRAWPDGFYWTLGEAASPFTESVHAPGGPDAAAVGGVTYQQPGPSSNALLALAASFNGSTGYATSSAEGFVDEWTVEAWVFPTAARHGTAGIIAKQWPGSGSIPMMLGYGNPSTAGFGAGSYPNVDSCPMGGFYTGATWAVVASSTPLPLNTWSLVAVTWDGTTLSLYVNGALAASSVPGVTDVADAGTQMLIGRRWDTSAGAESYFPGRLAGVAVYPVSISAEDIAYHYEARNRVPDADASLIVDLGPYITRAEWTRGKPHTLAAVQPGQGTIELFDDERRFEPEYFGVYSGPRQITPSGNEITDATRAFGIQGDGLLDDSSFGIWPAATNVVKNGGAETSLANLTAFSGAAIARVVTEKKFGQASVQVTTPAGVAGLFTNASAAAPGQQWTESVWVKGPAGQQVGMYLQPMDATNTPVETLAFAATVLTGSWQRISRTGTVSAPTATQIRVVIDGRTGGQIFYLDGIQLETGGVATPYIHTDGATATRAAALVQAPAALIDETQFWAAFYIEPGFDAASTPPYGTTANAHIFEWGDDDNNKIRCYYRTNDGTNRFFFERIAAGVTDQVTSPVQTFSAYAPTLVVVAAEANRVRISINGSAFTNVAGSHIPTLASTLLYIGRRSQISATGWLSGNARYAVIGTGTLADSAAAALHTALMAGSEPDIAAVRLLAPTGEVTAVLPFDTAAFETLGPYYPYVVPEKRVWLNFKYGTGVFSQAMMRVDSWPTKFLTGGRRGHAAVAERVVALSDGLARYTDDNVTLSTPQEKISVRWRRLMQALFHANAGNLAAFADMTGDDSDTAAGWVLAAQDYDNQDGLSALRELEETEGGLIFESNTGEKKFYGRDALRGQPVVATFTDGTDDIGVNPMYDSIQFDYDNTYLYSTIEVSQPLGRPTQTVFDPVARRKNGRKVLSIQSLWDDATNAVAQLIGQVRLARYSAPQMRVSSMTVTVFSGFDENKVAMQLDLGDLIIVEFYPEGDTGPLLQQYVNVEQISVVWEQTKAVYTFQLSPADTAAVGSG